jgi:hypothetical protein
MLLPSTVFDYGDQYFSWACENMPRFQIFGVFRNIQQAPDLRSGFYGPELLTIPVTSPSIIAAR